jgi:hypothetical protein
VNQFDLCDVDLDSPGYWISKDWLKDWRLVKPKMHVPSLRDPAPDSPDFNLDVRCEHGGLSMKITARRRVSSQVNWSALLTTSVSLKLLYLSGC